MKELFITEYGIDNDMSNNINCNECIIKKVGYAQAYVPYQMNTELFGVDESLVNGTVFTALNQPYVKGMDLELFYKEDC